jgi:hypothetical protein
MNFTPGQHKNHSRPGAFVGRDWSALEKRLNETRELLKEILANLQLVLHNLRTVNRHAKTNATDGGTKTKSTFGASPGAERFARAKRDFAQAGQSAKAKTASAGFGRASSFTAQPGGFGQADKNAQNPYTRAQTPGPDRGSAKAGFSAQEQARQKAKEQATAGAQPNGGAKTGASGAKTNAAGPKAGPSGSQSAGRQYKAQAGSSRREYRRTFRPRGEMTLERARAILCLTSAGCVGDIKSAYRKKARQYHPDLGGDEEMMKDLNLAYDLLLQYHFDHEAPTERNQ